MKRRVACVCQSDVKIRCSLLRACPIISCETRKLQQRDRNSVARIAFLLLCHKRADRVLEQARVLTSLGDYVAIHIDGRANAEFARTLHEGLRGNDNVIFADRVKCGWGEWSLVQATLNMVKAADKAFADATHFFLMSGDCMPIKPAHYIRQALDNASRDYIEHADFFEDNWIKTGLKEERLIYRHWFNERKNKRLFYLSLAAQQRLGLTRNIPKGLRMRIGSQWWVLRRETIRKILDLTRKRHDIMRFFRTTWIPDETFFQTLVTHLVPKEEVAAQAPTFLMFSDYGMPLTFYGDHFELLRGQEQHFARKISDNDDNLRRSLAELFVSDEAIDAPKDTGRAIYHYVRQRGRIGHRFAPRAWDAGAALGPGYGLTVVICKKWHIGNRIIDALRQASDAPAYGYVFDEDTPDLPDLGGIENRRDKRGRHRRAFLKLLLQHHQAAQMTICLDPSNLDALRDLGRDGCVLRVLEIDCDISDDWLSGHAERIGLGVSSSNGAMQSALMATLRQNIVDETQTLRGMGLPHLFRITEGEAPGKMARALADAFDINVDAGARIARTDGLFE